MRKLALSALLLLGTTLTAPAATVLGLGVNPNSIGGAFSSATFGGSGGTGSGAFDDQITFSLIGGPAFLTIASVTNVFATPSDFISNFTGSVLYLGANGVLGGGDDLTVIGPVLAADCPFTPNCQGFAGSAILTLVGNYALDISGIGGGTSGYGGNLAVSEVPIPPALILFASGVAGIFAVRRRKQKALNGMA